MDETHASAVLNASSTRLADQGEHPRCCLAGAAAERLRGPGLRRLECERLSVCGLSCVQSAEVR